MPKTPFQAKMFKILSSCSVCFFPSTCANECLYATINIHLQWNLYCENEIALCNNDDMKLGCCTLLQWKIIAAIIHLCVRKSELHRASTVLNDVYCQNTAHLTRTTVLDLVRQPHVCIFAYYHHCEG